MKNVGDVQNGELTEDQDSNVTFEQNLKPSEWKKKFEQFERNAVDHHKLFRGHQKNVSQSGEALTSKQNHENIGGIDGRRSVPIKHDLSHVSKVAHHFNAYPEQTQSAHVTEQEIVHAVKQQNHSSDTSVFSSSALPSPNEQRQQLKCLNNENEPPRCVSLSRSPAVNRKSKPNIPVRPKSASPNKSRNVFNTSPRQTDDTNVISMADDLSAACAMNKPRNMKFPLDKGNVSLSNTSPKSVDYPDKSRDEHCLNKSTTRLVKQDCQPHDTVESHDHGLTAKGTNLRGKCEVAVPENCKGSNDCRDQGIGSAFQGPKPPVSKRKPQQRGPKPVLKPKPNRRSDASTDSLEPECQDYSRQPKPGEKEFLGEDITDHIEQWVLCMESDNRSIGEFKYQGNNMNRQSSPGGIADNGSNTESRVSDSYTNSESYSSQTVFSEACHSDYDDVEIVPRNLSRTVCIVKPSVRLKVSTGDSDIGRGSAADIGKDGDDATIESDDMDHVEDHQGGEGDEGWVDWADQETPTLSSSRRTDQQAEVILRPKKSKSAVRQRNSSEILRRQKRGSTKCHHFSSPERTSVSYEYDDVEVLLGTSSANLDSSEWEDLESSSDDDGYEMMGDDPGFKETIKKKRMESLVSGTQSTVGSESPMIVPRQTCGLGSELRKSVPPPFDPAPVVISARGNKKIPHNSSSAPVNIPRSPKVPRRSDSSYSYGNSSDSMKSNDIMLVNSSGCQDCNSNNKSDSPSQLNLINNGGSPCNGRPPPRPSRSPRTSGIRTPPVPPSRRSLASTSCSPALLRHCDIQSVPEEAPPIPYRRRDSNASLASVSSNQGNGETPPIPPRDVRRTSASEEPPPTPPRCRPPRVKELTPDTVVPVLHNANGEPNTVKLPPKRSLPPMSNDKLPEGFSTALRSARTDRESLNHKILRHSHSANSLLTEVPPPPPYRPKQPGEPSEAYGYIPPDPCSPSPTTKREGYLSMDSVEGAGFTNKRRQSQPSMSSRPNRQLKRRSSVGNYIDPLVDLDSYPASKTTPKPFVGLWAQKENGASTDSLGRPNYLQLLEDVDGEPTVEETAATQHSRNSLLFEDEPLYQIYHSGSLLRRLAEQNMDGNEDEVYDDALSVMTSTLVDNDNYGNEMREKLQDIIRSGSTMRRYWCEMPEVRDLGILRSIPAMQKQFQEALFEIITSEASYLKSLNLLIQHFYASVELDTNQPCCILDKRSKQILFSNIVAVRDVSQKFMEDLEVLWRQDCCLTVEVLDLVRRYALDDFRVYVHYCSNQVYQERMLQKLKDENSVFQEVLLKLERDECCQSLSIQSFLTLPMQRITRMPLLVDAVCHRMNPTSNDYARATRALSELQRLVKQCNEGVRQMSNLEQITQISRMLDFKNTKMMALVSQSRSLVKKGKLQRIVKEPSGFLSSLKKKETLHLFLFNDFLLITKKKSERSSRIKSEEQYHVIDYAARISVHAELISDDDIPKWLPNGVPGGCKHLFLMALLENHQGRNVEYYFSCESLTERMRWVEAVTPAQQVGEDERIYEVWDPAQVQVIHKYTATEPDELSLEESDVVNVFRKMADGWYEGERIRDGERGWFPSNYTVEIQNAHVRAKNLRMRYRLLTLSHRALLDHQK